MAVGILPRGARIELTVQPGFVILPIVLGSFGRVLRGLSYTPCEIQFARRFVCPPMSADDTAITAGGTRGNNPAEGFRHGKRKREGGQIGRAHVRNPRTFVSRMPSSACKKKQESDR